MIIILWVLLGILGGYLATYYDNRWSRASLKDISLSLPLSILLGPISLIIGVIKYIRNNKPLV